MLTINGFCYNSTESRCPTWSSPIKQAILKSDVLLLYMEMNVIYNTIIKK